MAEFEQYPELLHRIKQQIQQAQVKVVTSANQQLLLSYWQIGSLILLFQQRQGWGAKVIDRLSTDIRQAHPGIEGFSTRNMGYMKKFVMANLSLILQHPVAKLPEPTQESVDLELLLEKADDFEQLFLQSVLSKVTWSHQQVKRYGTTRAGTQRYRCFDCSRTFVRTYTHKARDPLVKAQIIQLGLNGSGVRDTARVLGINRNTVSSHFKKK